MRIHLRCSKPSHDGPCAYCAHQTPSFHQSLSLARAYNLALACRQLYSETRILPFKFSQIHVAPTRVDHDTALLTDAQRDAVKTVRLPAIAALHLYYRPCPPPTGLDALKGLGRVVIYHWQPLNHETGLTARETARACEAIRIPPHRYQIGICGERRLNIRRNRRQVIEKIESAWTGGTRTACVCEGKGAMNILRGPNVRQLFAQIETCTKLTSLCPVISSLESA
jgi:hypothetical protein